MTTPIIYYGGKTTMLPHILPIIPEHDTYSEVFFGGGAVFFAKKKAANETINDRLGIVVNFYRTLKRDYKKLKGLIDETLLTRDHHNKAKLIIGNPPFFSDVERAWALWMACNFSHFNKLNGTLRYSNYSRMSTNALMKKKKDEFTQHLVRRIEDACIENDDALTVLKKRDTKNAFHYIDPPYVGVEQGHYSGYSKADQAELLQMCQKLKGKFILSNHPNEALLQAIEANGWWSKSIELVNPGTRRKGNPKVEILVANFKPVGAHTLPFDETQL